MCAAAALECDEEEGEEGRGAEEDIPADVKRVMEEIDMEVSGGGRRGEEAISFLRENVL